MRDAPPEGGASLPVHSHGVTDPQIISSPLCVRHPACTSMDCSVSLGSARRTNLSSVFRELFSLSSKICGKTCRKTVENPV